MLINLDDIPNLSKKSDLNPGFGTSLMRGLPPENTPFELKLTEEDLNLGDVLSQHNILLSRWRISRRDYPTQPKTGNFKLITAHGCQSLAQAKNHFFGEKYKMAGIEWLQPFLRRFPNNPENTWRYIFLGLPIIIPHETKGKATPFYFVLSTTKNGKLYLEIKPTEFFLGNMTALLVYAK